MAPKTPIVYASSVAAFDAAEEDPEPSMSAHPGTLYGVFKRANESTAWVYYRENAVLSVGLRPHTVYGPGRDQGLTSAPTTAMLAAAAAVAFTIPYVGSSQLQYARDVARAFIAASLSGYQGASVHNLPGTTTSISELIETIAAVAPESAGTIAFTGTSLPFPDETDANSFATLVAEFEVTPLADGIAETITRFRDLLARDILAAPVPEPRATS